MKDHATFFSVIIPVYNRPQELDELLACLSNQSYNTFEILVIEDGSSISSKKVAEKYQDKLQIHYFFKENAGQGFARNYAFERAKGDFFIILDSDALVESSYLEEVNLGIKEKNLDLFGGPDKDHPSFSPIQKAISFSMTSLFTTGGIRGKEKNVGGQFHPRSFNMGISRKVWEATKGFKITRMGEDIEFSIRSLSLGFKSALLPKAFIYHKRRTDFSQFYKQLHFFGRARINISRFYPNELKWVHFFPACYLIGLFISLLSLIVIPSIGKIMGLMVLLYWFAIFIDAIFQSKSLKIGILGLIAANIQLIAYGQGFLEEAWKKITNKPS
ncbi:glycosyltransferase [Aquirufa rosea]|uniref:Glycosyltransferase n=1 Tax=Aquirufa rosea TaxID=2509241 RepID=A0A4V1M5Q1_9BACT|nr:glycosyltransferase [Aquirufa rosea]RXK52192.1 glycosyltransferase [Aquirufa rosea]